MFICVEWASNVVSFFIQFKTKDGEKVESSRMYPFEEKDKIRSSETASTYDSFQFLEGVSVNLFSGD